MRLLTLAISFLISSSTWAFPCYLNLAKDSCWTKYTVSVDVLDALSSSVLTTVVIPAGKSWAQQAFTCEPSQKSIYHARFTPVFWQGDEDKFYSAERFWFMPGAINPGDTAWTIPVCFAADFSEVPLPPDARGNCKCDFSSIPLVKPQ